MAGTCFQGEEQRAGIELQFKPHRLKNRKIIQSMRTARMLRSEVLTLRYVLNNEYSLGITATRKVGNACLRNYIKRKIRNAFESACKQTSFCLPISSMIYTTKAVKNTSFLVLQETFMNFLSEMNKKYKSV